MLWPVVYDKPVLIVKVSVPDTGCVISCVVQSAYLSPPPPTPVAPMYLKPVMYKL